jgi:hypothetical protein
MLVVIFFLIFSSFGPRAVRERVKREVGSVVGMERKQPSGTGLGRKQPLVQQGWRESSLVE